MTTELPQHILDRRLNKEIRNKIVDLVVKDVGQEAFEKLKTDWLDFFKSCASATWGDTAEKRTKAQLAYDEYNAAYHALRSCGVDITNHPKLRTRSVLSGNFAGRSITIGYISLRKGPFFEGEHVRGRSAFCDNDHDVETIESVFTLPTGHELDARLDVLLDAIQAHDEQLGSIKLSVAQAIVKCRTVAEAVKAWPGVAPFVTEAVTGAGSKALVLAADIDNAITAFKRGDSPQ